MTIELRITLHRRRDDGTLGRDQQITRYPALGGVPSIGDVIDDVDLSGGDPRPIETDGGVRVRGRRWSARTGEVYAVEGEAWERAREAAGEGVPTLPSLPQRRGGVR